MRRRPLVLSLAFTAAAALALPAAASAKTWTAWAGSPSRAPSSAPQNASLNLFFPATLRVRAGDSVRYRNNEFHTVSLLRRGTSAAPPIVPDPAGGSYDAGNDAAGNPFFFNGMAKFIYNPATFAPAGGTTVSGTSRFVNSGVFGRAVERPNVTWRFTRRGSFNVICLLHPGMRQRVVVGGRRSRVSTDAGVRAVVARESTKAWRDATAAARRTPPANTVYAGVGDKATVLGFVPQRLTVPAGTSVDFVERSSSEIHNMVFGPKDFVEAFFKAQDLLPAGPGAPNQAAPIYLYGSQSPPNGPYTYDGQNLGNGFLATPLIDNQPGNPPQGLPSTTRISFTAPGTYPYFCAIHGPEAMSGEIVVT